MAAPSISRKARPRPESRCMMKPSPPKKPALSLFWKKTESSTPPVEPRKPLFCTTRSFPGVISMGRMEPGKLEARAIIPGPPWAV